MADSPQNATGNPLEEAQEQVDVKSDVASSEDSNHSEDTGSEDEAKRKASVVEEYGEYISGKRLSVSNPSCSIIYSTLSQCLML